jgi:hypothetical protein
MTLRKRLLGPLLGLAALSVCAHAVAAEDVVQAKWKVQEIKYSYVGFTTAYDCDSAELKLKSLLTALGAHPDTRVNASGCFNNRPARNFFVTITAATPVPADEFEETKADKSRQELLKRLGVKGAFPESEFPASWQVVDISKLRKLDIRPGDCELIEGLRDHVLPKLSVRIEEDRVRCTPNQLSIQPPQLRVLALTPMKSPDASSE